MGTAAGGARTDAIRSVYNDLAKTLKAHGLTFKNVVKENVYTTDLDALKAHLPVRRGYYGKDFPAAMWVQVARLYDPAIVLGVEVSRFSRNSRHG